MNRLVEVGPRGGAVALACTLLTFGCSSDKPGMVDNTGTDTETTGLTSLSGTESDSDSGSTGSTGGFTTGGTTEDPNDLLCKYIDFVFVVDNSASMGGEQVNLERGAGFRGRHEERVPNR